MKLVTLSFSSARDFMVAVVGNSIFYQTRTEFVLGEPVVMEVRVPGLVEPMVTRGHVTRLAPDGALIRVEDEATMDFLKDVASGLISEREQRARSFPRFPVDLKASCRVEQGGLTDELEASTVDLGAGGAFLTASRVPKVGSRVRVVLGPTCDTGEQLVMFGRVTWTGTVGGERGFGLRFRRSAGDGTRLRQMLRHSRETGEIPFAA